MTDSNHWYDKNYKKILVLPIAVLVACLVYLFIFYNSHGDFIYRDISLSGGTTITLQGDYDQKTLEESLRSGLGDIQVREIGDLSSGKQLALIISSAAEPETLTEAIENSLSIELTEENSNIEFSGPTLGNNFYKQLAISLLISFILMSLVIFFLFRTFVPSATVVFASFAEIVMVLALTNILSIKLSAAGIAAFLMLIGYSVDTNILLTTRVLKKREGTINQRIYSSFKTGIFMTVTALLAVLPAFFIVTGLPDSFRQIFLILSFGLSSDIITTWLTNASVIKWYAEKKRLN